MFKILLVHNYLRPPSGENVVYESEKRLLLEKGHKIITYERNNKEITSYSFINKSTLPLKVVWARDSYKKIANLIKKHKPSLVHFHNTFPLISPTAYRVCYKYHIPIVQTLHNYRMICPGALLFRNGKICEDCITGSLWNAVKHKCYHDSCLQTSIIASMIYIHRLLRTWDMITVYIALNEFCKSIFIKAGLKKDRIFIKPNFIPNNYIPSFTHNNFAIFIGRLSREKGLYTLLNAWRSIKNLCLKIIGEGPMKEELKKWRLTNVEIMGYLPKTQTLKLLKQAYFLVLPAECYETFSLVVHEAFACGKPVIASRLGILSKVIKDKVTGLLFEPGNVNDLVEKIKWMINHKAEAIEMGKRARVEFEDKYIADKNYELLMDIYQKAIEINKKEHGF